MNIALWRKWNTHAIEGRIIVGSSPTGATRASVARAVKHLRLVYSRLQNGGRGSSDQSSPAHHAAYPREYSNARD